MKNLAGTQNTLKGLNIDSTIVTGINHFQAIAFKRGKEYNASEWKQTVMVCYKMGVEFFISEDGDKIFTRLNNFIAELSPYSTSIGDRGFFAVEEDDNQMLISRKV